MKTEDYLQGGKAYVWKETFAVTKSKRPVPEAFANIIDKNEITVVIDEAKRREGDAYEVEQGWKLITFEMVLPFGLVGFLARIASSLTEAGISLFAISAYSTDHVLVKEAKLAQAVSALEALGLVVEKR